MPWQMIDRSPIIQNESQLQELFNGWPSRYWTIAGAPRWLVDTKQPLVRQSFPTVLSRDRFKPDVIFQTSARDYVVELKHAHKHEPLALAQTLYYVHMLKTDPEAKQSYGRDDIPISGVMVTQQSVWLRAALAELFENAAPSVQLLEYDTFKFGDKKIIWFGDPFAEWTEAADVPSELVDKFGKQFWYYVESEETWIGMPAKCERKPLFTDQHVVASRLAPGPGFVAWEGSYKDSSWKYEILFP